MYEKIKTAFTRYPSHYYIIGVIVFVALLCIICVWFYSNRSSNIDTTGIRNANIELQHAREYNQQSIDYNQRARNAVENSQTLNERTETRINTSLELNSRTENAVDRSTELTTKARTDAERAKAIISESRNILERAKERNTQSQDGATQK